MAEELHNLPNTPVEPIATGEFSVIEPPPEQGALPALHEYPSRAIADYQSWAEKYPFAATAVETAVVFAAKRVVAYAGDRIGLNTRNALTEDHLEAAREHPVKVAANLVILAPIVEELQSRGPSWLRCHTGDRKPSRILDTIMLLGFAVGHAGIVRPAKDWTKPPFVKVSTQDPSVPIIPLIGGANYARLSEQRGFAHGIFAHALNNAMEGVAAISEVRRRRSNRP